MLCSDIKAQLLAPDGLNGADLSAHLAGCPHCRAVAAASEALDGELRSILLAAPPAELAARLTALEDLEAMIPDAALRSTLVVEPPPELQANLSVLIQTEAIIPDVALRSSLVIEPPAELQSRLLNLVAPASAAAEESKVKTFTRLLAVLWKRIGSRPSVLAAQFAALAVLAYAIVQVGSWLLNGPLVLGDVPYAIELLLWSPAVDYLQQVQGLLQQLGMWLLVAAAGWLVAQGPPWRDSSAA